MSIDPFLSVDLTESEGEVEPRKRTLKFHHESGVHAVDTPELGKEREPRRVTPTPENRESGGETHQNLGAQPPRP